MAEYQSATGKRTGLREHTEKDTVNESKWDVKIGNSLAEKGIKYTEAITEDDFKAVLKAAAPELEEEATMLFAALNKDKKVSWMEVSNLLASLDQDNDYNISQEDITKIAQQDGNNTDISQTDIDKLNIGTEGHARVVYGDPLTDE